MAACQSGFFEYSISYVYECVHSTTKCMFSKPLLFILNI